MYGLPSIIGRLLNYLLVPLHTSVFLPEKFGVITEMYSYVAFLVVLLTFGMETAYFRFVSKKENFNDRGVIFSTTIVGLLITTIFFWVLSVSLSQSIANFLHYPDNSEYVVWFAIIVGFDALSAIPLAKLRMEGKAKRFAGIYFANILVNFGLNWLFLGYCMKVYPSGGSNFIVDLIYRSDIGVGYVFLANLFASLAKFILLSPEIIKMPKVVDWNRLKAMFLYGSPLLLGSLAIIVNEHLDKILLKHMLIKDLGESGAIHQVGIYGACYKLSVIMMLFIQAFRYAAEPFFFSHEKEKNSKATYAMIMKYFVMVCSVIFLGVVLYMDVLKYFIQKEEYWEGLSVVPILLMAYFYNGIFYNLSAWYKLSGKTKFGAYISLFGAAITIVLNLLLIPIMGYMGSAWATVICYFSMAVLSYVLGQRNYSIPYDLKQIIIPQLVVLFLYFMSSFWNHLPFLDRILINTCIFTGYLGLLFVWYRTYDKGII